MTGRRGYVKDTSAPFYPRYLELIGINYTSYTALFAISFVGVVNPIKIPLMTFPRIECCQALPCIIAMNIDACSVAALLVLLVHAKHCLSLTIAAHQQRYTQIFYKQTSKRKVLLPTNGQNEMVTPAEMLIIDSEDQTYRTWHWTNPQMLVWSGITQLGFRSSCNFTRLKCCIIHILWQDKARVKLNW